MPLAVSDDELGRDMMLVVKTERFHVCVLSPLHAFVADSVTGENTCGHAFSEHALRTAILAAGERVHCPKCLIGARRLTGVERERMRDTLNRWAEDARTASAGDRAAGRPPIDVGNELYVKLGEKTSPTGRRTARYVVDTEVLRDYLQQFQVPKPDPKAPRTELAVAFVSYVLPPNMFDVALLTKPKWVLDIDAKRLRTDKQVQELVADIALRLENGRDLKWSDEAIAEDMLVKMSQIPKGGKGYSLPVLKAYVRRFGLPLDGASTRKDFFLVIVKAALGLSDAQVKQLKIPVILQPRPAKALPRPKDAPPRQSEAAAAAEAAPAATEPVSQRSLRGVLERQDIGEFGFFVYDLDRCSEVEGRRALKQFGVNELASFQRVVLKGAETMAAQPRNQSLPRSMLVAHPTGAGVSHTHTHALYHTHASLTHTHTQKTCSLWLALGAFWRAREDHRRSFIFATKQKLAKGAQPAKDVWCFYRAAGPTSFEDIGSELRTWKSKLKNKTTTQSVKDKWRLFAPSQRRHATSASRTRIRSYAQLYNAVVGKGSFGQAMYGAVANKSAEGVKLLTDNTDLHKDVFEGQGVAPDDIPTRFIYKRGDSGDVFDPPFDPLRNAVIAIDEADVVFRSGGDLPDANLEALERAVFHSYESSGSESVRLFLGTATPAQTSVVDTLRLINVLIPRAQERARGVGSGGRPEYATGPTVSDLSEPDGTFGGAAMRRFLRATRGGVSYVDVAEDTDHFPERERQEVYSDMGATLASTLRRMISTGIESRRAVRDVGSEAQPQQVDPDDAAASETQPQQVDPDDAAADPGERRRAFARARMNIAEVGDDARDLGWLDTAQDSDDEEHEVPLEEEEPEVVLDLADRENAERSLRQFSTILRNMANFVPPEGWRSVPPHWVLGHPGYTFSAREELARHLLSDESAPKLLKLLENIRRIDGDAVSARTAAGMSEEEAYRSLPKHLIISDIRSERGARLIASALEVAGYAWRPGARHRALGAQEEEADQMASASAAAAAPELPPKGRAPAEVTFRGVGESDDGPWQVPEQRSLTILGRTQSYAALQHGSKAFVVMDEGLLDFERERSFAPKDLPTLRKRSDYKLVNRTQLRSLLETDLGTDEAIDAEVLRDMNAIASKRIYYDRDNRTDKWYLSSNPRGDLADDLITRLRQLFVGGSVARNASMEELRVIGVVNWIPQLRATERASAEAILQRHFNDEEGTGLNEAGEFARIVVMSPDFTTGTELFDVEHLHLFDSVEKMDDTTHEIYSRDRIQLEGRGWRNCGHAGLRRRLATWAATKSGQIAKMPKLTVHEYRFNTPVVTDIATFLREMSVFRESAYEQPETALGTLGFSVDDVVEQLRRDPGEEIALHNLASELRAAAFDRKTNEVKRDDRAPLYTGYALVEGEAGSRKRTPLFRPPGAVNLSDFVNIKGVPVTDLPIMTTRLEDLWVAGYAQWDINLGRWLGMADVEQLSIEAQALEILARHVVKLKAFTSVDAPTAETAEAEARDGASERVHVAARSKNATRVLTIAGHKTWEHKRLHIMSLARAAGIVGRYDTVLDLWIASAVLAGDGSTIAYHSMDYLPTSWRARRVAATLAGAEEDGDIVDFAVDALTLEPAREMLRSEDTARDLFTIARRFSALDVREVLDVLAGNWRFDRQQVLRMMALRVAFPTRGVDVTEMVARSLVATTKTKKSSSVWRDFMASLRVVFVGRGDDETGIAAVLLDAIAPVRNPAQEPEPIFLQVASVLMQDIDDSLSPVPTEVYGTLVAIASNAGLMPTGLVTEFLVRSLGKSLQKDGVGAKLVRESVEAELRVAENDEARSELETIVTSLAQLQDTPMNVTAAEVVRYLVSARGVWSVARQNLEAYAQTQVSTTGIVVLRAGESGTPFPGGNPGGGQLLLATTSLFQENVDTEFFYQFGPKGARQIERLPTTRYRVSDLVAWFVEDRVELRDIDKGEDFFDASGIRAIATGVLKHVFAKDLLLTDANDKTAIDAAIAYIVENDVDAATVTISRVALLDKAKERAAEISGTPADVLDPEAWSVALEFMKDRDALTSTRKLHTTGKKYVPGLTFVAAAGAKTEKKSRERSLYKKFREGTATQNDIAELIFHATVRDKKDGAIATFVSDMRVLPDTTELMQIALVGWAMAEDKTVPVLVGELARPSRAVEAWLRELSSIPGHPYGDNEDLVFHAVSEQVKRIADEVRRAKDRRQEERAAFAAAQQRILVEQQQQQAAENAAAQESQDEATPVAVSKSDDDPFDPMGSIFWVRAQSVRVSEPSRFAGMAVGPKQLESLVWKKEGEEDLQPVSGELCIRGERVDVAHQRVRFDWS